MSRPSRIPDRGDVALCVVASRLGLTLPEFQARRSELERRGFPEPDETTGRYCIEAVDRWRLRRHASLFPELTCAPAALHAGSVFDARLRRMGEGGG
jgi:hypothetical protein